MGSVSKNNRSCCGAVGVHKNCLTSRQEAPRCNAILLEVTSLPYWLPLPDITALSSQTEPFITHTCGARSACFLKILRCHLKLQLQEHFAVLVLYASTSLQQLTLEKWCHGSWVWMDSSARPNTNRQHSGALGFQQNRTKCPETS